MKKLALASILFLFLLATTVSAQITILFPENDVTYGPWSDTYFDYPKTGGKAHHIRLHVDVDEAVAYYRVMRNQEWVQYTNNEKQNDAVPDDAIVDFEPTDLEPLDMVGYLSAMQEVTVIAYDEDNNELGMDTVVFYLAVDLDDYYELIDTGSAIATRPAISDEDLAEIAVTKQQIETTEAFFTVTKTVTRITVKNLFTDETEEHTRVHVTIEPKSKGAMSTLINVYSIIPKEIVEHLNSLTIAGDYSVLDPDPIMMWNFAATEDPITVEYDIDAPLSETEIEKISIVAIADIEAEKTQLYFLIPLVIPIILLFGIVYFNRFKQHAR